MTVRNTVRRVDYPATGATSFPFPFRILSAQHLVVTRTDVNGNKIPLTAGVHYQVQGIGSDTGGTILYSGHDPSDRNLRIERVVPLTQETRFRGQGAFRPELHEDAIDKLTMAVQQLGDQVTEVVSGGSGGTGGNSGSGGTSGNAEPYLGLPSEDGMVLASSRTGTRTWVRAGSSGGGSTTPGTGTIDPATPQNSDILTVAEKPYYTREWSRLQSQKAAYEAQNVASRCPSQWATYVTAFGDLSTYLSSGVSTSPVAWNVLTDTTNLGAGKRSSEWNPKWQAIAQAEAALGVQWSVALTEGVIAGTVTDAMLKADFLDPATGKIPAETKIKPGSITTPLLAANAVFAKNMVVANFDNLIPNANSELDLTGVVGAIEGVGVAAVAAHTGVKHRALNGSTGIESMPITPPIPVIPGERYWLECQARTSAAKAGTVYMRANYYTATGQPCSPTPYEVTKGVTGLAYQKSDTFAGLTVPATAATVIVELVADKLGAGVSGYYDSMYLRRMADSSLIVDGTITGTKLKAASIDATKVNFSYVAGDLRDQVVAAINASSEGLQIQANKVVFSGLVKAGEAAKDINLGTTTIEGGKITTQSITGDKFAANVIFSNDNRSFSYNGAPSTYATSGFRFSGSAYGVTDATGVPRNVTAEFGHDVLIGGFLVKRVVDRSAGRGAPAIAGGAGTSTSSSATNLVSMSWTPSHDCDVLLFATGVARNSAAGSDAQIVVNEPTGSEIWMYRSSAANQDVGLCIPRVVAGLKAGTTYSFSLGLAAPTGGTASATLRLMLVEL